MAPASVSAQSFSDVNSKHPSFQAIEYLKQKGIISGYADGTFKPGNTVTRSEAAKILVAPIVPSSQLAAFTSSVYDDVPEGVWYLPYVEAARQKLGIIDGPPKTSVFNGQNAVTKIEFLKMLLLAQKVDPNGYAEVNLPFSDDANPKEWYYPYLRVAITSSITTISADGSFELTKQLTRADVAEFTYRLLMYREGRRTQALLSETETEIVNVLNALDKNDITHAEFASIRALLAARGAHASRPDEPLVQAALKTTESFRLLVRAYRAGVNGELDTVIELTKQAWTAADEAKKIHSGLASVADQVQVIAKNMADSARALKESK